MIHEFYTIYKSELILN